MPKIEPCPGCYEHCGSACKELFGDEKYRGVKKFKKGTPHPHHRSEGMTNRNKKVQESRQRGS